MSNEVELVPPEGGEHPLIAEMADLLADYKLVPFFGAGLSRQHLGFAGAELAKFIAGAIQG